VIWESRAREKSAKVVLVDADQCCDLRTRVLEDVTRRVAEKFCVSLRPRNAAQVVSKDYAGDGMSLWKGHFERIPFGVASDGASDTEANARIIIVRAQNECWAPPALFASSSWIEIEPNNVALARAIHSVVTRFRCRRVAPTPFRGAGFRW
jgi:hypothetical protein